MESGYENLDAAFPGDALTLLIGATLCDRGMSEVDVLQALDANPPSWDSFARQFVDGYEPWRWER